MFLNYIIHHSSTTIDAKWFPKREKSDTFFLCIFFLGVGVFQKSYVIFRGGISKYLLFLTGVGGWSGKGQKTSLHNVKMVPNAYGLVLLYQSNLNQSKMFWARTKTFVSLFKKHNSAVKSNS